AEELKLKPSQHENLLGQDYLFALRCIGDNIPVRPKLLHQLMGQFAEEYMKHTQRGKFTRYHEALEDLLEYLGGSQGGTILLQRLLALLQDSNLDAETRQYAALTLGELGKYTNEVVIELFRVLRESEFWHYRRDAARLLGKSSQDNGLIVDTLWQG